MSGKQDFGAAHWSSDKVYDRKKKSYDAARRLVDQKGDILQMEQVFPLKISWLGLMAMHGSLCLALRHPKFKGDSRQLVVCITRQIGKYLVENGICSTEIIEEAEKEIGT